MASQKPPPGHFTLLYFASASSYIQKSSDHLPAPVKVSELFDVLEGKYPGMKQKVLSSCALTVNLDYVDLEEEAEKGDEAMVIREGDEVAVLPPVSSG